MRVSSPLGTPRAIPLSHTRIPLSTVLLGVVEHHDTEQDDIDAKVEEARRPLKPTVLRTLCSLSHACPFLVQVEEAAARSSRQAKAVLYNPRAGEVWAFDQGKVVQRTTLADPKARLFERAEGSVIRMLRSRRIEPTDRRMPFAL